MTAQPSDSCGLDDGAGPQRVRDAAREADQSRTALSRRDLDDALVMWRGLVEGRWSLVDRFDRDGRRFLIARRTVPAERASRALTVRERQVLAYAAGGHVDKEIAYRLGLGRSTITTHLARAMRKLGIEARVKLTQWPECLRQACHLSAIEGDQDSASTN